MSDTTGQSAAAQKRWVRLSGVSWLTPFLISSPFVATLLVTDSVRLASLFVRGIPMPWAVLVLVAVGAAIVFAIVQFVRLRYPPVRVNPALGLIRAGRRTASYAEITTARLLVTTTSRRGLTLLLQASNGLRAIILVRDSKQRTLDPKAALLVADLIERSSIALPISRDDPKGRFARYNFPDHVTRDDALALVEHPPAESDPLPIPPQR